MARDTLPAMPNKTRPFFVMSKRAVAERIHRLRYQGDPWHKVAGHLNTHRIARPKHLQPWTVESARTFYKRAHPTPLVRHKRRVAGKPLTRAECYDQPWLCPWASCRYHLAPFYIRTCRYDTRPQRRIGRLVESGDFSLMPYTCALDVAEHEGPITSGGQLARLLKTSRNQIWKITQRALAHASAINPDAAEPLREAYESTAGRSRKP